MARRPLVPVVALHPIPVAVSACLLGQEVRYDGGHKREPLLAGRWGCAFRWVPVCPEVEIGLGVPREPIRLEGRAGAPRLVSTETRRDLTETMGAFARSRVAGLVIVGVRGFILKKGSPSCGVAGVEVFGAGGVTRDGAGLFAAEVRRRLPLIPVEDESHLREEPVRERFLARVRAFDHWKRLREAGPRLADLAAFQAHYATALGDRAGPLDALLARAADDPLETLLGAYEAAFLGALG